MRSFQTFAAVSTALILSVGTVQVGSIARASNSDVSPPSDVIATPDDRSIDLTWTPSAAAASTAVESYRVSTQPTTTTTVVPGGQTTAHLSGLTNGRPYVASVVAVQGGRFSTPVSTIPIVTQALITARPPITPGPPITQGPQRPLSKFEPPFGSAYLGVSSATELIGSFDATAGITTHPAIFNAYTAVNGDVAHALGHSAGYPGTTPMVSWEVRMSGNAVLDGSLDAYLAQQAAAVNAYGKPVFLRLNWEMNGSWYPAYDSEGGTSPAVYIASWQYIHRFFVGVTNAAFVWSPAVGELNAERLPAFAWYPGDDVVDWIAADAYPDYKVPLAKLTGPDGLDELTAAASQHGKPFMLAEWARGDSNATPDTATAIDMIFDWAEAHPDTVKALLYFDYPGTRGHDLETHPVAAAAFRARTVGNPRYLLDVVTP